MISVSAGYQVRDIHGGGDRHRRIHRHATLELADTRVIRRPYPALRASGRPLGIGAYSRRPLWRRSRTPHGVARPNAQQMAANVPRGAGEASGDDVEALR